MSLFNFDESMKETIEAIKNPRVGDRFTEMYCFWMYVLDYSNFMVTVLTAQAPCTVPRDGEIKKMSLDEYRKRFIHKTMGGIESSWIMLVDRDNDVDGWLPRKDPAIPPELIRGL